MAALSLITGRMVRKRPWALPFPSSRTKSLCTDLKHQPHSAPDPAVHSSRRNGSRRFSRWSRKKELLDLKRPKEVKTIWSKRMHGKWDETLFPMAKSWYQGSNIPGRKVEPLNWSGGMVEYVNTLNRSLDNDFQGWKNSTAKV